MTTDHAERCETCGYSRMYLDNRECRRYAPRPSLREPEFWQWPAVSDDDWCGEWTPKVDA